jgi:hypothetical protein
MVVGAGTPSTIDLSHQVVREVLVLQVTPSTPGPAFAVRADAILAGGERVPLGTSVVPGGEAGATFLLRLPPDVLAAWDEQPAERALRVTLIAVDSAATVPGRVRVTVTFRDLE